MGYGVVEGEGVHLRHISHGVIKPDLEAPLEVRLKEIFFELRRALELYRPEAVAVEGVFAFRNARSALILGHARGVALLAAAEGNLPVFEYAPARVKRSVGASGSAAKDGVARMVRHMLTLGEVEREDATDALAVALCHLNQVRAPGLAPARVGGAAPRAKSRLGWEARLAPAFQRNGVPK